MISTRLTGRSRAAPESSANGRTGEPDTRHRAGDRAGLVAIWSRFGPFLVSSLQLLLGYLHYAPGTAYSLSAEHYRAWAFPAFRYSDLIWLYLRDRLEARPLPYVDYELEYPPLTGFVSWLLSWAPDLHAYFTLAYGALALAALIAVWALQRTRGANVWLFAASPALFFYTGHQWDIASISFAALALLALQRGRTGLGIAGLVIAASLKLFPVVFVAATVVERLRNRHFRSAALVALGFAAGTLAINLPVALASFEGWSFFFRWNRDRLADSGIWVLWRDVPTADLTRWSLAAAVAGGVALSLLALRTRGPLVIPLGATYLLWWLLVNKTFTTHLMLWAILALSLLSAPWWLWGLAVAADLVGFQLGNYLNLYNVPDFRHAPLIRKAVENVYDPVQIARSVVLLASTLWGIHVLRLERLRRSYTAQLRPANVRRLQPRTSLLPRRLWIGPVALRRAIPGVAVTMLFTVATVAMTWPYARHLGGVTVVGFDPYLQIWLSEWIRHALATNPLQLYEANIFYPFAQTLAYTDANVPGALVAAPLRLLSADPIMTNSVLTLASFVVAAGGVYALIVYLTGNRGAAIVAGLAYAFLPYRMVQLWHLNWLEGGLLPWLILALVRLVDRPSLARGVTLGLLAAVLVLTSFYFSLQIALVGATLVVARTLSNRAVPAPDLVRCLAVAAAVSLAIAVPFFLPYLQVRAEQGLERSIAESEQYKALPTSYLQLAPWDVPGAAQRAVGIRAGPNESLTEVGQAQHADGHQHAEIVIEDALYPGIFASVFAIVGLAFWRRRRWLAVAFAIVAAVAFVLSLGPTFGARHGNGPPLPYGWLFDHVPLFRAMRVPARLGGLVDLMVVLLAGLGIAAAWSRLSTLPGTSRLARHADAGPLLTALLSLAVLAELWTGAIPLEPVDRSAGAAAAAWLANQPAGPVMIFPAESVFADPAAASVRRHYGEMMFWSTRHWRPLVNGNSGFIPRTYSDFIERFVGVLPRPDGTSTSRISHVNAETLVLLQQIGVRYLVFDRLRYQPDDWMAVRAQLDALVATGALEPGGDHGDATVFALSPVIPPLKPPQVTLYAPTLMTPDSAWGPWVAIDSQGQSPSVLALTQPARLETRWYDDQGKELWRGVSRLPLPAVLDDPLLLCSAVECLTSRSIGDPLRLPPPAQTAAWLPETPGHYVVRLRLSGDQALDCRVDLDLVATAEEARKRSGEDAFRWATCLQGHPNPVNNPGLPPFTLSPPSVTLIDNTAAVEISVTSRREEELRGWFILAPPGSAEPWREVVYRSPVQQRLAAARIPTAFAWDVSVSADVAPGVYGLTVWFHRRGEAGWEHAAGGDIGLAPIVVADNGSLRWAGPIRIALARPPAPLRAGTTSAIDLTVSGIASDLECMSTWRLWQGGKAVASGNGGRCATAEFAIPEAVSPGQYRLEIDALATGRRASHLSDRISLNVTVLGPSSGGGQR